MDMRPVNMLFACGALVHCARRRQHMWLLHSMLPREVVSTMQRGEEWARGYDCCVVFADSGCTGPGCLLTVQSAECCIATILLAIPAHCKSGWHAALELHARVCGHPRQITADVGCAPWVLTRVVCPLCVHPQTALRPQSWGSRASRATWHPSAPPRSSTSCLARLRRWRRARAAPRSTSSATAWWVGTSQPGRAPGERCSGSSRALTGAVPPLLALLRSDVASLGLFA